MKKTYLLAAAAVAVFCAPLATSFARVSDPPVYLQRCAQYVSEHPELTPDELRLALALRLYEQSYQNTEIVKDPASVCVYVGKHFALPEGYAPASLVAVDEAYAMKGVTLRSDCYAAFLKMARAMELNGFPPYIKVGYRVNKPKSDPDDMWNAWPNHSEHQLGLAFDLRLKNETHGLLRNYEYEKTAEYAWLCKNAYKYGFILSYPEGKEDITGFYFEPWHWRYVSVPIATDMKEKGFATFPEYWATYLKNDGMGAIANISFASPPPDTSGCICAEER
ncbi:MAG TPA: M15 family metallopeptidase [Clostridia bacterium]|nr:M15 family metallopeptidase [Clostridia bacterium]